MLYVHLANSLCCSDAHFPCSDAHFHSVALMLTFPAQGHIQAMMQLSKILYARGFYITFVNTEYIQERLDTSGSVDSVKSWPDFRFETLPDGLPPERAMSVLHC
jgi:hypothetical protein